MSPELAALVMVPVMYLLLIPAALLTRTIRRSKKLRTTIVAQYAAPDNLSPAEVGFLFDDRFGPHELLAAIVGMHQKGTILLSQNKKKQKQVSVPAQKPERLDELEFAVYDFIAGQPHGTLELSDIMDFSQRYAGIEYEFMSAVSSALNDKGYLDRRRWLYADSSIRKIYMWLSLFQSLVIVSLLSQTFLLQRLTGTDNGIYTGVDSSIALIFFLVGVIALWPVMFGLYLIANTIFYYFAGLPKGSTAKLTKVWPEIEGYRDFIRTVEFGRLQADNNLKDAAYPWCLAFGLDPGVSSASNK